MRPRPHACPAALAFLSAGPHDVRPHLVALYYADDDTGLAAILRYGVGYMTHWSERRGLLLTPDAIRHAVAHGLLRLWRPEDAGPTDNRAKQCGLRAEVFRLLSNAARDAYRRRLTEGAIRFVATAIGSEDGRPRIQPALPHPATWWNAREAGRPAPCRLVELKIGHSPPELPRAPSRDTGWLPTFDWAA